MHYNPGSIEFGYENMNNVVFPEIREFIELDFGSFGKMFRMRNFNNNESRSSRDHCSEKFFLQKCSFSYHTGLIEGEYEYKSFVCNGNNPITLTDTTSKEK